MIIQNYERGSGGYTISADQVDEIENVLEQVLVDQAIDESAIGLAVPLYEKILQIISIDDNTPKPLVAQEVWNWFKGASGVNTHDGYFADFIHYYTQTQRMLRGGGGDPVALAQAASNQIGIKVAQDIIAARNVLVDPTDPAYRTSELPGIVGIGVADGAAGAERGGSGNLNGGAEW